MQTQMNAEVLMVDPGLAAQWLEKNCPVNRPVQMTVVSRYANAMRLGEWRVSHQGVAFNVRGDLIDGQHRLHAVVAAQVAVPMMVTFGAPDESFEVLDGGLKRSVADQLSLNSTVLSWLHVCLETASGQGQMAHDRPLLKEGAATTIYSTAEAIMAATGKNTRKLMGAAAVGAAAVVSAINGVPLDWVIEQRRILVMREEDSESNVARAFRHWAQDEGKRAARARRHEVFARALRVFDPAYAGNSKIVLRPGWNARVRDVASAAVNKAYGREVF